MPYHRRNKKRHRNKSSPQIASSPKKYRQTQIDREAECGEIKELSTSESESESLTDSASSPTMGPGETAQSSGGATNTPYIPDQANAVPNNFQNNAQQMFTNPAPQFLGGPGPAMMDSSMMQPTPMSPMPFGHQHTTNAASPMTQFQQIPQMSPQMSQYPGLSDVDIMRIARQLKTMLSEEIQQLVETRVSQAVEPIKKELDSVKESLVKLQTELKQIAIQNDDLEQYSRRSCLRISGVAENNNEDVSKLVLDLAVRIGADIRPEDIDRTHRVGKPMSDNSRANQGPRVPQRNREIIVKFNNYSSRLKFLKGRAKLREQNANIFINEDLTMKRKNLAYECRKLKKAKSIIKTWVYNGSVFVEDRPGNKVHVTELEDLDAFKVNNTRVNR